MKIIKFLILLSVITFLKTSAFAANCYPFSENGTHPGRGHKVESYQGGFQQCVVEGRLVYIIRSFNLNGNSVKLAVDPRNMSSEIIASRCLNSCQNLDTNSFLSTLYGQVLSQSGSSPYPLQNDGITSGSGKKTAITIDMCPSSRGFSDNVYKALTLRARSKGRPIPVGVAMTRGWLNRWTEKFNLLKSYHARGILSIEWINHSSTHPYRKGVNLSQNFLLSPGVDIVDEVLGNEVAMVQAGITPASYFRFPGLVSNRAAIGFVTDLGLVTLGSDAWLAKNQAPSFGSIILIHGNRNEPVGETQFLNYIKTMDSKGHRFGHINEAL